MVQSDLAATAPVQPTLRSLAGGQRRGAQPGASPLINLCDWFAHGVADQNTHQERPEGLPDAMCCRYFRAFA